MKNLCTVNIGEFEDLVSTISKIYINKLNKLFVIDDIDYYATVKRHFNNFTFFDFTETSRLNFLKNNFITFNIDELKIEYYLKYLDIFCDICDRYEYNNSFTTTQRITHFYQLLNHFDKFIDENNINEIIFNHTPHHINTFCLYLVCKKKNIKIKINTKFSYGNDNKFTIDTDIFDRCIKIKNINRKKYEIGNNLYLKNILKKFEYQIPNYMLPKTGSKIKYFRLNYNSLLFLFIKDIINLVKSGLFKRAKYYLKINKKKFYFEEKKLSNLSSFLYRSIQRLSVLKLKIDYFFLCSSIGKFRNEEYCIFFPNYQPEATTTPSSRFYSNIFLVLENIQSIVGPECIIFYKEHPSTFDFNLESFFKRDKFFYNSLKKRFKNLKFISQNLKNYNVLKNSKISFCQTSNVALEALKLSKPTIIFGNVWFDNFYNICKFKNLEETKNYLQNFNFNKDNFENELLIYDKSIKQNSYNLNFIDENDEKNLINLLN